MHTLIWLFCIISIFSENNSQMDIVTDMNYNSRKIFSDQEIMDWIDTSNITSECSEHLKLLSVGLRNQQIWPLKMLDASSKLQSGILKGNVMDLGAFDECIGIHENTSAGELYGQYCLVVRMIQMKLNDSRNEVLPGNEFTISFLSTSAVCVPHTCTVQDIEILFKSVKINVTATEDYCQSQAEQQVMELGDVLVLCFLGMLLLLTALSTLFDIIKYFNGNDSITGLINSFSAIRNGKMLCNVSRDVKEISCINGIKVLSLMWILQGHVLIQFFDPVAKNASFLSQVLTGNYAKLIMSGTLAVDTFLLLSGLMVSYNVLLSKKKGYKYSIPVSYLRRIFRLTPNLLVVVLVWTFLLKRLGSGPVWHMLINGFVENCKENWWITLLYVQNYVNVKEMCIAHSWYLAVEMQCHIFAPVLILPLFKRPKATIILASFISVSAMVAGFVTTWINEIHTTGGLNETLNFMYNYHFLTHTRAAPWVMGFILGYFMFSSMEKEKIILKKITVITCWTVCLLTIMSAVILKRNDIGEDYNLIIGCFENAFRRPAWALAVAWIIYSCHFGYGGFVNTFLSMPIFKVFSRLTYSSYLLHMLVLLIFYGSVRDQPYFSYFLFTNHFCSIWFITQVLCAVVFLTVELPLQNLQEMCLRKSKSK